MKTDIEIAQESVMKPITEVAESLDIAAERINVVGNKIVGLF